MAELGLTTQAKTNLAFFLNDFFLDSGLYENINVNEEDFASNFLAVLQPSDDDEFPIVGGAAKVWRSPFTNWVYESGIIPPSGMDAPIIASGVVVSGTFFDRADITFGHIIDYERGRIVFDSAQSTLLDIRASFARKQVRIKLPNRDDEILMGRNFYLNPDISTSFLVPSGLTEIMPLVLIEHVDNIPRGKQLGGGKIVRMRFLLHILAEFDDIKDDIKDVIENLDRDAVVMVDWNSLEQPLDYNGDFGSGQAPFSFKEKQANNSIFFHKLYFETLEGRNVNTDFDIEKAVVDIEADVYF